MSDTVYVKCHRTGTSGGDPIENAEGASGILSVLKTVLALEKKTIPVAILYGHVVAVGPAAGLW